MNIFDPDMPYSCKVNIANNLNNAWEISRIYQRPLKLPLYSVDNLEEMKEKELKTEKSEDTCKVPIVVKLLFSVIFITIIISVFSFIRSIT